MAKHLQVVDLGTKKGGAIGVFIKSHGLYFDEEAIKPANCLGVDYNLNHKADVVKQGYQFQQAKAEDYNWRSADYHLAFDFLEHLPDVETSKGVLREMLRHSNKGVWLRLPSFEADRTNIARLAPLGLRFSWTTWSFHPSHFCKEHVRQVLAEPAFRDKFSFKAKGNMPVKSTAHPRIVTKAAPADAANYDGKKHGPKATLTFDPPLYGQWEVLIKKKL